MSPRAKDHAAVAAHRLAARLNTIKRRLPSSALTQEERRFVAKETGAQLCQYGLSSIYSEYDYRPVDAKESRDPLNVYRRADGTYQIV